MSQGEASTRARIVEIDMLRGLVIVLMALDHVRDYFHDKAFAFDPLDLTQTDPAIFMTRWITHLCAPTFVLLSGVSIFLQAKVKSRPALARFLLTRGLWLVFLEVTLISFGWSFGFPYPFFLQVIWAIGWGMIAMAALIWLPHWAVLGLGCAIVAGHNLLDPIMPESFGAWAPLWTVLHDPGLLYAGEQPVGLAMYPLLPWLGIMALGFGLGPIFNAEPARRDRIFLLLGLGMLAAFVLLRGLGLYGEPRALVAQDAPLKALLAFIDVTKYPPSLLYVLVTLGVALLLWPLLRRLRGAPARVLATFGAVPFFFYLLHIYLVHALSIVANAALGRDASPLFDYFINAFTQPERFATLGFPLWGVYLAWLVVLVLLYPLCAYWRGLKQRRRDWWLSYV